MKKYPPQDEQDICVACGFCCDHTLYDYAFLKPKEEVSGHFAKSRLTIEGSDYFRLPCPHFECKCTIYDQDKPSICSDFKCELLKRFGQGQVSKSKAIEIIEKAKALRSEVFDLYETIYQTKVQDYRAVLEFVNGCSTNNSKEFSILKAKTNLLSILLNRHFESQETLKQFMTNEEFQETMLTK